MTKIEWITDEVRGEGFDYVTEETVERILTNVPGIVIPVYGQDVVNLVRELQNVWETES